MTAADSFLTPLLLPQLEDKIEEISIKLEPMKKEQAQTINGRRIVNGIVAKISLEIDWGKRQRDPSRQLSRMRRSF